MSRDELVTFINHSRTMRTSPPTFTKQLRQDEEIAEDVAASDAKPKTAKRKVVDPNAILKELLERAAIKKDNQTKS
jgi:hypothetical protein